MYGVYTGSTLDPLDKWINFAVSGVFSAKHCVCYMHSLSNQYNNQKPIRSLEMGQSEA